MESNPFCSQDHHISDQTILNVLDSLKRYNVPFTQAAQQFHLTTAGVIKIFDTYVKIPRLRFPEVICVDELYFSRKRKKKYILIIINFFNRAIIDILKDRSKSTISSYMRTIDPKERARVKYVCIDMNDNYRDILSIYFKNASIVADSFHVMKHATDALDSVRLMALSPFKEDKKSDEYYLLKYRDSLLYVTDTMSDSFLKKEHNKHFHCYLSKYDLLTMMLDIDPRLKKAYGLYHSYKQFNDSDYTDTLTTLNDLNELINTFKLSDLTSFVKFSETLSKWKAEIVNSFIKLNGSRVSNGPMEGRNSLLKKILRIANGYSNFERFRNRAMYCLNTYSKHSFNRD